MIPAVLIAAAAAILFLPENIIGNAASGVRDVLKAKRIESLSVSIDLVSRLKARLAATAQLTEPEKKALEILTLALVAGSDQP